MEDSFSCLMANCSMIFENEDQLLAHQKKHELSLSLTPSPFKNPFILDQTPTPTQFLSPVSLELQDLQNDNPFDATFRKANSTRSSNTFLIPESSSLIANLPDSEVLNTPSIILPSEPATPISLKPIFSRKVNLVKNADNHCVENTDSLPFSPNEQSVESSAPVESLDNAELPSESANFSNITSEFDLLPEREKEKKGVLSKNVLQTSVITSVGNTAILKSSAVGVPTAVVVTRAPVNSISSLSASPVSVMAHPTNQVKIQKSVPTLVQAPFCVGAVLLSINVENGQCIQLPFVNNNQPSTVTPIAPQVTSTTSTAKMKLKEVLTQNQKGTTVTKKVSAISKAKAKSPPHYFLPDSSDGDILCSPPGSPIEYQISPHNGRKRRELVDDPDEKRKRSLERNRAAATRCRKKKKMWISSLEKKAVELSRTNVQLQAEVTSLRNEVAHLKTLLLAHKDCPVTLQQKAEKETYTTVRIITSAPSEILPPVPIEADISSQNSDFLEMEGSSVQSNDSSLTSDMSEASYRER